MFYMFTSNIYGFKPNSTLKTFAKLYFMITENPK